MPVGPYNPDNIQTIHPSVAVSARRFIRGNGEQATVQGQFVNGASEEAIAAGGFGPCAIGGTVCVEAGAPIALGRGGGTFEWVMTDANGRAITYVAGNAAAGFITVAATVATQQLTVHMVPSTAPIIPD